MNAGTLNPIVREVVFYRSPQMNEPGEIHRGVLTTHAISCKVRAQGTYMIGAEQAELSAPYLNLGASGELDGNGLQGPVEMYWCRFSSDGLRSGPGPNLTLHLHDTIVSRSHFRPLASSELKQTVGLFRELLRLSTDPQSSA